MIQLQVDQRIYELSQLAKTGMDTKECVSHDQLTMGQWMAGFCHRMRDELDPKHGSYMLDYLITLLDLFIWGFTLLSTLYRSYHDR